MHFGIIIDWWQFILNYFKDAAETTNVTKKIEV
jgi:hypothetical protein